jgi:hypothetical protein
VSTDPATIATNATKPKSASSDGTTVQQHSIGDQIMADQYNRGSAANARKGIGIRMHRTKVGPPGGS